jgi:hypothetical protein
MIVAFPLPSIELSEIQLALVRALHRRVPPPVFVMVILWRDGFAPPCVAVKEKLVGLTPIIGTALGETVNVTGIVTEDAPVALIRIVPV